MGGEFDARGTIGRLLLLLEACCHCCSLEGCCLNLIFMSVAQRFHSTGNSPQTCAMLFLDYRDSMACARVTR